MSRVQGWVVVTAVVCGTAARLENTALGGGVFFFFFFEDSESDRRTLKLPRLAAATDLGYQIAVSHAGHWSLVTLWLSRWTVHVHNRTA